MWSFPLIWPAVLEKKMFEGFRVNSIWPTNRVTYQLEINKLVKGYLGESVCEFLPQSVKLFWRRRFKKFINFQSKMADEPCDLWHHKFIFCFKPCIGTHLWSLVLIGKVAFFYPRWPPHNVTCDVIIFSMSYFSTSLFSLLLHFITLLLHFITLLLHFITLLLHFITLLLHFVTLLLHFITFLLHFNK